MPKKNRIKLSERPFLKQLTPQYSKKMLISVMLLSFLIASCFFSYINAMIETILPLNNIEITVKADINAQPNEVWMVETPKYRLKDIFETAEYTGEWTYFDTKIRKDIFVNAIVCGSGNNNSIDFSLPNSPSMPVSFWKMPRSGVIQMTVDGKTQEYDLRSTKVGGEYLTVYPFKDNKQENILLVAAYAVLSAIIFTLLLFLIKFALREKRIHRYLQIYNPLYSTLAIFFFVYIFNLVSYKNGIPNFLSCGDEGTYWLLTQHFGLKEYAASTPTFRGYLCYLIPDISQWLGRIVHIDPIYIYFLFIAITVALMVGYIVPRIYCLLTDKVPRNYHIIVFMAVFTIFWNAYYYSVVMDIWSLVAYLAAMMYTIAYIKSPKYLNASLAGFCLAAACLFKGNYLLYVWAFSLFSIAVIICKIFGMPKKAPHFLAELERKVTWKILIVGLTSFFIAFVIICIPQTIINSYKGHIGILPYDEIGAYGDENLTLMENGSNNPFMGVFVGPPFVLGDKQTASIKTREYDANSRLNFNQIFHVYATSPLDSLVSFGKKALMAFDIKTNKTYPDFNFDFSSRFYLFSTLNYIILGTSLYILFNKSFRRRLFEYREIIFWLIIAIIQIIPLLIVGHIEWRYFLVGYVFSYYIFSYTFVNLVRDRTLFMELLNSNYVYYLVVFVLIYHTISLTMYHV